MYSKEFTTTVLLITFSCLIIAACSKSNEYNNLRSIPYSIFLKITKNGNRLPDSVLDNLKLSYYQNGSKKYISDFIRCINEGGINARDLGFMTTNIIGINSGDYNIKDYYIEYPNGTNDTLFVDYRHLSTADAANDSCACLYPLKQLKYNGIKPKLDTTIKYQTMYIFESKK